MRRAALPCLFLLLACGPFFYQAPPSLGSYPERVAAKRWQHLFEETKPLDPALPNEKKLDESCHKLVDSLAPLDAEKRFAEIDKLLAENRNGPYSVSRANFLHELRELAADPALFTAAKDYIQWRMDHDAILPKEPPAERPWDMEEQEFNNLRQLYQFQSKQRLTFFKERLAKSDELMRLYWLARRGSFLFASGRYQESGEDFTTVMEEFPDHPRAEVAELMMARCKIEQSRALRRAEDAKDKDDEIRGLLDEADTLLAEFVNTHPKGRFTPDAVGWRGAVAFDKNLLGEAVKHQLDRLDMQPTREITRTVLRECDMIFEKLLQSSEAGEADIWLDPQQLFDAPAVARHPLVARLFVQHCIDPAAHISLPMWWDDSYSGDRGTIDFLKRRILNPHPFVRLALAELGKELIKAKSVPDATTLTLLAWSATEDGEHEQALALLDQIPAPHLSDEALLAKGVIFQRIGRHADAVAAFEKLAADYPSSPLLGDQPYQKSVSLFKSGHAGKAMLEILPLVIPKPIPVGETREIPEGPPNLHPDKQLIQWLDTLIQFSPLEELETAYAGIVDNTTQRAMIGNAIRTRALAAGRFDLAARFLSGEEAAPAPEWEWLDSGLARNRRMTREDWDKRAAPLVNLHAELAKNPPASEKEKLHLAIARQWMEQRGFLTLPSLSLCYYAASEEAKQDLLRRRNALELGFGREAIHRELDHRDEATLALEHALEAAKSGDPAIAAPALELANQCLFRRAEFSLYQKSRAMETDATKLSADLHAQLTKRFPDSVEAKRSVYFTFAPAAGPWMPGDYNSYNAASALIGALNGHSLFEQPDDSDASGKIDALGAGFAALDPKETPAVARKRIKAAMRELDEFRALTNPEEQGSVVLVIDRLDDLLAAASLPGIRGEDLSRYAAGDFKSLPPAFKSLLYYRDRVKVLTDVDGNETGLKNDTIEGWREFLETYPDSPKAEAASFRMTRLVARQYRTSRRISAFHFPEAPIPNGYKRLEVIRTEPASDPEAVIAAIRQHEARFPAGRYRDDLNLLMAGALIDSEKFALALELLDLILANPVQRDLHVVAALEFADIAQRLIEPDQRAQAAKAIRRGQGGRERLRRLVDGDTFLSRLKPLMPWLENG
jgi:TolA-binding protein